MELLESYTAPSNFVSFVQGAQGPAGPSGPAGARGMPVSLVYNY